MAGRLKRIVDFAKTKAQLKGLLVVRLNMKMDLNVEEFKDDTPDDPELEKKLIAAVREILHVNEAEIPR